MKHLSSVSAKAFTLLEILISVSILALLATFMFPVVDGASTLWRSNEQRVDSYREARAALQFISQELNGIIVPDSGSGFPKLVINSGNTLTLPPAALTTQEGGGSLFFLANVPADAQQPTQNQSSLCAVGYYLAFTNDRSAFDPSGSISGTAKLYRFHRSSADTFDAITTSQPPFAGADPGNSANNEILARNITSFTVTGLRWDEGTSKYEVVDTWPEAPLPIGSPVPPEPTPPPQMIEISMTALNTSSAARMTTRAQWTSKSDPLYTREAQTFTVRIDVRQ